jgi:uncharacterized protein
LAVVLTRVITREGWQNTGLRPNFRRGWLYYAAAWLLPAVMVILGAVLYFVIFPQHYDPELTPLQGHLPAGIDPWTFILLQVVQAILLAPVINALFTFGEEFGWRGYLLPRLMPLGWRKAMLVSGVIWGAWHWPLTAMGHNYGLEYPGFPWLGMLAMVWFTLNVGIFLSWVTLRSGSVWPAVIGHGALNGIGALPAMFMQGDPLLLIGPVVSGVLGGIGFLLLAVVLFFGWSAPAGEPATIFRPRFSPESPEEAATL